MGKGTPPSVSWGDVALLFPQALSFAPARRRCRLPALRCGERIAFPLQPYCASREERPFPMLDPGCRQSREKGSFSPYRSRWPLKEGKLGLRWEKAALASTFRGLCFLFWGFCPCALSALPLRASLRGEAGLFPPCPSCPPHALSLIHIFLETLRKMSESIALQLIWPVGQAVKTPASHAGNGGSIPPRVTRNNDGKSCSLYSRC